MSFHCAKIVADAWASSFFRFRMGYSKKVATFCSFEHCPSGAVWCWCYNMRFSFFMLSKYLFFVCHLMLFRVACLLPSFLLCVMIRSEVMRYGGATEKMKQKHATTGTHLYSYVGWGLKTTNDIKRDLRTFCDYNNLCQEQKVDRISKGIQVAFCF